MNVSLDPILPRTAVIGVADDPYKKYWWAILAGIVVTGLWLCLPILTDTAIGSTSVAVAKSDSQASAERGLEATDNPDGAPGRAYDLAMDAPGHRGAGSTPPESMLYQAPADSGAGAAAAGAPLSAAARGAAGAAVAGNLAEALKSAGRAKNAAGWGEKAQRGFDAPRLSGGSLGGLGSVSGHSTASAGGIFGTHDAAVGYGTAHGLNEGAGAAGPAAGRGFVALSQTASAASRAATQRNADGSAGGMSKLFDGAKGQGTANAPGGKAGVYDSLLDAAPSNLKGSDPAANSTPPPAAPADIPPQSNSSSLLATMAGMAVGALIGGAVGGAAGQAIASGASMAVQQAMQQQQQAQQCQQFQSHYPSAHCS